MILTVESQYQNQDESDRQDGMKLPMFSRSGKSPTSQYIVFQNKKDNEVESKVAKIIYRGDDQPKNKKKGLEGVSENSSENDDDEDESCPNDFKTKV